MAAGAIPACIRLLEHSNQECCCHAAEVLLHLASSTAVRRRLIARAGALEPLYGLLLSTSPPVQSAAAHLLQVRNVMSFARLQAAEQEQPSVHT